MQFWHCLSRESEQTPTTYVLIYCALCALSMRAARIGAHFARTYQTLSRILVHGRHCRGLHDVLRYSDPRGSKSCELV